MELHELEICDRRAGAVRERDPSPTEPGGSSSAPTAPRSRRSRAAPRAQGSRARSVTRPTQRPSSVHSSSARSPSLTSMRGCARTAAARTREISLPVAAPPTLNTRRRECPPSRPSSTSKSTPRSARSTILACASWVRTCTADSRQSPRPARSVSSACSSGESSGLEAAATPPCASQLELVRTGPFERMRTRASAPAHKAPERPATPLPTTIRSYSRPISGKFSTQS